MSKYKFAARVLSAFRIAVRVFSLTPNLFAQKISDNGARYFQWGIASDIPLPRRVLRGRGKVSENRQRKNRKALSFAGKRSFWFSILRSDFC